MDRYPAAFAIKTEVRDRDARAFAFAFAAQKTMYAGKTIAIGDRIFLFASETSGGHGLFARGIVTASDALPRTAAQRQTPRVSIAIARTGSARCALGRAELRLHRGGPEGSAEWELDFKLYRQATDKIVGLTARADAFLNALF